MTHCFRCSLGMRSAGVLQTEAFIFMQTCFSTSVGMPSQTPAHDL